ncbi:MAG: hypothetical protein ACLFP4_14110 [Spirochaetales bacterium]
MKRMTLFFAILASTSLLLAAQEQSWIIERFESQDAIAEQAEQYIEAGYTPVGIDVSDTWGFTMLFSKNPAWPATTFAVEEINAASEVTDRVTQRVRDGWLPVDLSFQNDRYIFLFIDAPERVAGWRILPSQRSTVSVQRALSQFRNDGYTVMGSSLVDDGSLVHLVLELPDRDLRGPSLIGVPNDPEDAATAVETLAREGWTPMGISVGVDELLVLLYDF